MLCCFVLSWLTTVEFENVHIENEPKLKKNLKILQKLKLKKKKYSQCNNLFEI